MRSIAVLKVWLAASTLFVGFHLQAQAQNYPDRPVKLLVSTAPGSGPDILARVLAEKLRVRWGQPVIVENRPGAGLNIGAEAASRAAPDGYTLLLTPQGPLVANKSLYRKLSYDPDALEPVTILVRVPVVLITREGVPVKTVPELIRHAKANPGKLNYGSPGKGSTPHLASELFQTKTGTRMTHVPYKSNPPAVLAMLSGDVDLMFLDLGPVLPHIRTGKLRALAMASDKRHPSVPEVPAITDFVPGATVAAWWGLMAPPKTPGPILTKVSQAVAAALKEPEVASKLEELGKMEAVGNSPAEAAAFIAQERKLWGDLIRSIDLTVD